jgi:hypothetical protein
MDALDFGSVTRLTKSKPANPHLRLEWADGTPDFGQWMLKSKGNPYRDPKTGEFTSAPVDGSYSAWLPPSEGISTLAEAKDYYRKHIYGVWTVVINRKAGLRKVKIDLRQNEEHAYTKKVDGVRVFWLDRARKMSAIINTLAHPGVVLENGGKDLFVERVGGGEHDVVVLDWKEHTKDYKLRSFHYWPHKEYAEKTASTENGGYKRAPMRGTPVKKDETPIRKSVGVALGEHSDIESPPTFPNLHRASLAGSCELGGAHTGIGWPTDGSIEYASDLVKSNCADVVEIYRAGVEGEIEITKAPDALDYGSVYRASHEPTPAQQKAGNYAKRRLQWRGLTISIENKAGAVRRRTTKKQRPETHTEHLAFNF